MAVRLAGGDAAAGFSLAAEQAWVWRTYGASAVFFCVGPSSSELG
jgi:hypothetical protein